MADPNAEVLQQAARALIDAAHNEDIHAFTRHTDAVCTLAAHADDDQRTRVVAALADTVGQGEVSVGAAADLSTVIHAVLALGADAHSAGPPVLRRVDSCAAAALRFLRGWRERTDAPPPPGEQVTAEVERLLADRVGPAAAQEVTMAWWTIGRFSAAAVMCLGDAGVRAWLRHRPELLARLSHAATEVGSARQDVAELDRALAQVSGERPTTARIPVVSGAAVGAAAVPPPPAGATPDARWGPSWRSARDQRRWDGWARRDPR